MSQPNANCTYCGKPVIWVKKPPEQMDAATAAGAGEFHRPLDATQVSAGYTIIQGAAYYVYVHPIHVCDISPVAKQVYASDKVVAAAFENQERTKDLREININVYGRVETDREKKLREYETKIWEFALKRPCVKCKAKKGERCTSLNKGAGRKIGDPIKMPHLHRYDIGLGGFDESS